ncbi:hypothetical protein GCM10009839_48170 [Catenulispora yoronensis]|uniref:DUF3592 domain-containing protein n=1 Tax=Catenulispora yoronensis TaxID=450799 RepID=A0ABN2UPP9_9ACTN
MGLVLWVLAGGELGAVAVGATKLGSPDASGVVEFVVGINLVPWTGLAGIGALLGGQHKRLGLSAAGPTEAAAARIESSRAVGEGPNFPVELDLTVAPEGKRAFRTNARPSVNLMDLDRYREGRNVVVDYDPHRPWEVTVRADPGAEWVERIALAAIDTAPEESRPKKPVHPATKRTKWYALASTAVGFALWFVVF